MCDTWLAGSTLCLDIRCPVTGTGRQEDDADNPWILSTVSNEISLSRCPIFKVSVCIYICIHAAYTCNYTSWYSSPPQYYDPKWFPNEGLQKSPHMGQIWSMASLSGGAPCVYPLPTKGFPAAAVDAWSHGLLWEHPLSLDDKAADAITKNLTWPPKQCC